MASISQEFTRHQAFIDRATPEFCGKKSCKHLKSTGIHIVTVIIGLSTDADTDAAALDVLIDRMKASTAPNAIDNLSDPQIAALKKLAWRTVSVWLSFKNAFRLLINIRLFFKDREAFYKTVLFKIVREPIQKFTGILDKARKDSATAWVEWDFSRMEKPAQEKAVQEVYRYGIDQIADKGPGAAPLIPENLYPQARRVYGLYDPSLPKVGAAERPGWFMRLPVDINGIPILEATGCPPCSDVPVVPANV